MGDTDKASDGVVTSALATVEPKPLGRPSDYRPELVQRVINALEGGLLLREVGRLEWAPDHATIYRWAEAHPDFRDALARARKAGADRMAEECVTLADNVDTDSPHGSARVSKVREQIGVRQWLAKSLDRDTYGDRPAVEVKIGEVNLAFAKLCSPVQSDDE